MGKMYAMRIPTAEEWDKLMDAAREEDAVAHWADMYSWVDDKKIEKRSLYRALRGYRSACYWNFYSAAHQVADLGFRPVFETMETDKLSSEVPDGDVIVVGTLYMNGDPVRVPQKPTWVGDIADFMPGSKLEMRPVLDDPAYQVKAIKVGRVLIADRNLLKKISYKDIEQALEPKPNAAH